MICKNCATAGDLARRAKDLKEGKEKTFLGVEDFLEDCSKVSDQLHNMCKGQTHCDCQHRSIEDTECVKFDDRSPSEQTK